MRGRRTAFTIIELLVLIAAIGILIGLLIPAVQQLRAVAARAECANNLKQIGLAALSYEHANKRLPPGIADSAAGVDFTSQGSIWTTILPYLEQGNLYKQFDLSQDVER